MADEDQLRETAKGLGLDPNDPSVLENLKQLQRRPAPPSPMVPARVVSQKTLGVSPQSARRGIGAVVGLVLVLYFTGHLDHLLYPVGLNLNECARNGFGAVYCGDELTEYRKRVVQPVNQANAKAQEALRSYKAQQQTEREFPFLYEH